MVIKIREYDRIMNELKMIVKDKLYVEDDRVRMRTCKYDLINLLEREEKKWLKELLKENEYDYDDRGGL